MPQSTDLRPCGPGLEPARYAALRAEVVRTAAVLTDKQLLDLADALHSVIRLRRPGRPIRRADGWADEPRSFV